VKRADQTAEVEATKLFSPVTQEIHGLQFINFSVEEERKRELAESSVEVTVSEMRQEEGCDQLSFDQVKVEVEEEEMSDMSGMSEVSLSIAEESKENETI